MDRPEIVRRFVRFSQSKEENVEKGKLEYPWEIMTVQGVDSLVSRLRSLLVGKRFCRAELSASGMSTSSGLQLQSEDSVLLIKPEGNPPTVAGFDITDSCGSWGTSTDLQEGQEPNPKTPRFAFFGDNGFAIQLHDVDGNQFSWFVMAESD